MTATLRTRPCCRSSRLTLSLSLTLTLTLTLSLSLSLTLTLTLTLALTPTLTPTLTLTPTPTLTLTLTPTLTLTLTPTPTLTLTLTLTKAPAAAARQAPRPPCVQFVRPGSIPLFGGASAWGPGLAPACFCGLRARLQGRKVPPGRWRAPAPGSRQPPKLPLSRCLETLARGSRPPLQAPSHRSRHSRFAQGRPHTASGARGRPLVQGGAPSPLGGARVTYP